MYQASVPVALQALERALVLLGHATPQMLNARLHPQMFNCAEQFEITAGFARRATFPLIGREVVEADSVLDRDSLRGHLQNTYAEIAALTPEDFVGAEDRRITHRAGFADLEQSAQDYLQHFAIPNLWFHLSMAFAILRAEGAPVGKAEFDGLHAYPPGFSWVE
ncbi:DUF1993 domain-containing protein [Cognatiyoonia sp. IB215182]|uniref:DUF1993 domain-containing protein n=1 Tax=Cognatiyoonia sp. IB215182 TaxID=3097353 RepID=UPI002A0AE78F|nr:DUF1993 domain-containing protein [Cognatiyoonia sp. IB215182]MDX8353771.1 DUF1993 domain-containing protein [Cognatiyoonia sp. IB215182]